MLAVRATTALDRPLVDAAAQRVIGFLFAPQHTSLRYMQSIRIVTSLLFAAATLARAQLPRQGGAARPRAQHPSGPGAGSLSVRGSGSSLGRIRLGAADPIWFSWQIGVAARAFRRLTFVEAA